MFAAAGRLDIPLHGEQTVAYLVRRTRAFDLEHSAKTSLGFVFNKTCDKLCYMKTVRNEDVVEAQNQLGLPSLVVKSPGITEYDLKHTDERRLKMLHDDTASDNKNLNLLNTRSLQNTAARHHKNNPHVSMEATFAYVMSNSSAFRALPAACIEKARRYLALPDPEDDAQVKSKPISPKNLETIFTDLNEALQELADSGQPLFLCGLPGSDGVSQGLCEYHVPPIDVVKEALETPTEKIDGHLPLNGQQTVDYLVGLTNDLVSLHPDQTPGYSFNVMCGRLSLLKQVRTEDVIEARKRLGLSTALLESTEIPLYSKFPVDSPQNKPSSTNQKKPAKPGTTVVHAERVVVGNKKMIKILEFENVQNKDDLPAAYVNGYPNYYKGIDGKLKLHIASTWLNIHDEAEFPIKEFNSIIKTMKEAGVRLSKINKTAKLEKEHSGKFTVSV